MTLQAIAGLVGLNLLFLLAGTALLWLVRGFATWAEVVRLGGLAYLTGASGAGVVWTLLLVAGVPFSLFTVIAVPLVIGGLCVLLARRRGRSAPDRGGMNGGRALLVTAVGIAAAGVFFEAAFRAARLNGLYAWDAWSFWVPKAKAIYSFGGLDEQFFTTLPGSSYPPLVPALDAAAFHVMGSPDVVTLHLQYWFLGLGFMWALVGLLTEHAPSWILWPFALLALAAPRVGARLDVPEADLFLDYLFVIAALVMFAWLRERERWQLVVTAVLLAGAVLTKREGLLLAAILVVATLIAGARDLGDIWRPLAGLVAVLVAVAVPWRVWYLAEGIGGETPEGGLAPSDNVERLWPSLELAIRVLFDSGYWGVVASAAVGALVLALLARAFMPAAYFASLIVLVTLGGGWITWAIPELEITSEFAANPIVRFMGAAALTCVAATPVLLAAAWTSVNAGSRETSS